MKELWSTVEGKAQEWGAVAGEKAQEWGAVATSSVKDFTKKMSCKKCVVKDFFKREWTLSEKVLFTICLFLLGIVIGFLIALIKKGISCGNNNGNTYSDDGDWYFEDEE